MSDHLRIALQELRNIAEAKRFDRERFDNDTAFADWAQSRARHTLALAAQEAPASQPDYSEMSREQLERHAARLAQAIDDDKPLQLWRRYAISPMLAPSCLVCGQLPTAVAIRHMDLPNIVVCETCHGAALNAAQAIPVNVAAQEIRGVEAGSLKAGAVEAKIGPVAATPIPLEPVAPAGWKLMPIEPTQAMMQAGELGWCQGTHGSVPARAAACYRAMLAAAPSAQPPSADARAIEDMRQWLRMPSDEKFAAVAYMWLRDPKSWFDGAPVVCSGNGEDTLHGKALDQAMRAAMGETHEQG